MPSMFFNIYVVTDPEIRSTPSRAPDPETTILTLDRATDSESRESLDRLQHI